MCTFHCFSKSIINYGELFIHVICFFLLDVCILIVALLAFCHFQNIYFLHWIHIWTSSLILNVHFLFILAGSKLQTTGKMEESKDEMKSDTCKPATPSSASPDAKTDSCDSLSTSALISLQSDVQPVGHDYVEEVGLYKDMFILCV